MSDDAIVTTEPGGPDKFQPRDITTPGPAEVRMRHTAVGPNFLDVYHRSGTYPWPVPRDHIAGSEGARIVEALGAGVVDVQVGDRVAHTHPLGRMRRSGCCLPTVWWRSPMTSPTWWRQP